jgi:hypothetical protein
MDRADILKLVDDGTVVEVHCHEPPVRNRDMCIKDCIERADDLVDRQVAEAGVRRIGC